MYRLPEKGGAKLVRLQTVGTYQPVVLLVDGAEIATSSTSVLQVGIASNAMLGNIQNAVNGNSSFSNTNYKIVNGYKAKVNIGQQNKHVPGTNEYQTAINNGQTFWSSYWKICRS